MMALGSFEALEQFAMLLLLLVLLRIPARLMLKALGNLELPKPFAMVQWLLVAEFLALSEAVVLGIEELLGSEELLEAEEPPESEDMSRRIALVQLRLVAAEFPAVLEAAEPGIVEVLAFGCGWDAE